MEQFYCCQNHLGKLFQAGRVWEHAVAQLGCCRMGFEGAEGLFQRGSCGFGSPCLHLPTKRSSWDKH